MGYLYKQKGSKKWWMKYYQNGRARRESTGTDKEAEAKKLLATREGDVARGLPITPRMGQIKIDELLEDAKSDYKVNGRATLKDLEGRCTNHLVPFFGGRKATSITTSDVNRFIEKRQQCAASNAEINRELAVLKRAFSLAHKAGKLLHKPHIPMLKENNVRQGFFEREQFEAVMRHLPAEYHGLIKFAYLTGWRCLSEIQTRQWKHIDWQGGAVRLEPGETKNREGRTFPFHVLPELRVVLEQQLEKHKELLKGGVISPWVFCREDGSAIKDFRKSWEKACLAAGLPGRIVHDFRRTAVRNLERAGVSRSLAMKLTGHLTEAVYRRYAIVCESDLAEAVTKLQVMMSLPTASKQPTGIVTGIVAQKHVQNPLSNGTFDLPENP